MLPVTNEQAKAIQKSSDFGKTVVEETSELARYIGRVLGTAPEDAVGLILGDPLHAVRTVIAGKLDEWVKRILQDRNVKETQSVSPSLAIPLLQAAYDESRPELQELWAELIAAAMDPNRSNRVRRSFIETVKRLDPLDALILKKRYETTGDLGPNGRDFMVNYFKISMQEVEVSLDNLITLKCVFRIAHNTAQFHMTPYGNELMRACSN